MSYAAISSLGITDAERRAIANEARRRAQAAAMAKLPSSAPNAFPGCIPERYRQAAHNWCIDRNTVSGLGAVDWNLPQEYQSDPCRAEELPACAAGQEPALTLPQPVTTTATAAAATTTTTAVPTAPPKPVAVAKTNYLMWGLIGGAGLLALLVWRASK